MGYSVLAPDTTSSQIRGKPLPNGLNFGDDVTDGLRALGRPPSGDYEEAANQTHAPSV
jgi:hypothetical protein